MYKKILGTLVLSALSGSLMSAHTAIAAGVTDAMIANDAKSGNDVLSYGMGTQGQRYSALTQINTKTVAKLVPAWSRGAK